MSTDDSRADTTSGSILASEGTKGTNPIRLVVLLLIFVVALAGLLYDYCIARPAQKRAYETLAGLLEGTTPDPNGDGTVTDDEVQSILGCKPSQTEWLSNGKIEIYTWRSGLPTRTHNLYVVFSGKQHPLLHFAATQPPESTELPPETTMMTREQLDNYVPSELPKLVEGNASDPEPGGRDKQRPSDQDAADASRPRGSGEGAKQGDGGDAQPGDAAGKATETNTGAQEPDGVEDPPAEPEGGSGK